MSFKPPKNLLQEMAVGKGWNNPSYSHETKNNQFMSIVKIMTREFKSGFHSSKKAAENEAAEIAYNTLKNNSRSVDEDLRNDDKQSYGMPDLAENLAAMGLDNPDFKFEEVDGGFVGSLSFFNKMLSRDDTVRMDNPAPNKKSLRLILEDRKIKRLSESAAFSNNPSGFTSEPEPTPIRKIHENCDIPATKHTPREYQKYFYHQAMKRDIICSVPTGMGKTLIATMVIKEMRNKNPNKKVLFLVERIPLVNQQEKFIKDQTGLSVVGLHGDMSLDSKLNQPHDVMVIISSLFLNLIRDGRVHLQNYSVMVFDEAHHIVKDHPYSRLLKIHYMRLQEDLRPKVMGLTASPAGKVSWVDTFISLKVMACISKCDIISPGKDTKKDMDMYKESQRITVVEMDETPSEQFLLSALCATTKVFSNLSQTLSSPSSYEEISNICEDLRNKESPRDFEKVLLQLYDYFVNLVDYGAGDPGFNTKEMCIDLVKKYSLPAPIKDSLIASINSIPFELDGPDVVNQCKLSKALEFLTNKKREDFKAILFVKTRQSASDLYNILCLRSKEDAYSFLKPGKVTGHSSAKTGGQSISSQKEMIEKFRNGEANVIVATSVLEEGLDVPECNIVIRIDPPSSVTSYTQSRGRLRSKGSEFYAITKPFESNFYGILESQEKHVADAIDFLNGGEVPMAYRDVLDRTSSPKMDIEELIAKCRVYFQINTRFDTKITGGSSHQPEVTSDLYINNSLVKTAKGSSKKDAEEKVSRLALESGVILVLVRDAKEMLKK